jgi:hypothetical protein
VPRAADLEKDSVLPFHGDFAVVQAARRMHDSEDANELIGRETREALLCRGLVSGGKNRRQRDRLRYQYSRGATARFVNTAAAIYEIALAATRPRAGNWRLILYWDAMHVLPDRERRDKSSDYF